MKSDRGKGTHVSAIDGSAVMSATCPETPVPVSGTRHAPATPMSGVTLWPW
jgi:hypothetical protein